MSKFGANDVVDRAIDIVAEKRLKSDHGSWCPWCALAQAKGELDREHGSGVPLMLGLRDYAFQEITQHSSDRPLEEAVARLRHLAKTVDLPRLTSDECLTILRAASWQAVTP